MEGAGTHWTARENALLREAMVGDLSFDQLAVLLGRTKQACEVKASTLRARERAEAGAEPAHRPQRQAKIDKPPLAIIVDTHGLMRRTLLHLLDLKRAGHSPTRTELAFERNGLPKVLPRALPPVSLTGSHF